MTGVDYNDEKWDKLVQQMSVDELVELTGNAGWQTSAIESVGKKATTDIDGPQGLNGFNFSGTKMNAYASEVLMGMTWNVELVKQMGSTYADEALSWGIVGMYAPAMNTHRSPFGGRNFEYFSEDPTLSGLMGAAEVSGMVIVAQAATMTMLLTLAWVPFVPPIKDAGIKGQFRFLTHPGPWFVLLAVFCGNSGIFCWWSYISPWLQKTGGWSSSAVPLLMVLAGFGMVLGGIAGGRLTDLWKPAATAALSQSIAVVGLLLVFLIPGNRMSTAMLTFVLGFALFFNSAPQQLLMVQAGQGGGELIAGAAVQIAFNFGNAVGSIVGGAALTATAMNYHYTGLSGMPIAIIAVMFLITYTRRYETDTQAMERMREVHV